MHFNWAATASLEAEPRIRHSQSEPGNETISNRPRGKNIAMLCAYDRCGSNI